MNINKHKISYGDGGFIMPKMEIELTEEQLEKVKILESQDVDIGQAIDLLFEMQNEALNQLAEQHDESIIEKMQDTGFDAKIKQRLMKKEYEEKETYDRSVQDTKHNVKWSKFFKF